MPSLIGWLDQSEEQQRSMREVIALFAESGTVDDLGLGIVRDAFADLLFPGLSTVQTRVRYFLIIPWVFQRLEVERISTKQASEKSREWEIGLIFSLMRGAKGSESGVDGIIGQDAKETLKQLPSFIYWSGTERFGIREFRGSRSDYFRTLDRANAANRTNTAGSGPIDDAGNEQLRWHVNLPAMPDDLWDKATLDLRHEDAAYLQERVVASQPNSLLAYFLRNPVAIDKNTAFAWDAVDSQDLPRDLARTLSTARYYSEAMHGAPLLYNLMLAEQAIDRQLPNAEVLLKRYTERIVEWREDVERCRTEHNTISHRRFWQVVASSGASVPNPAQTFISTWLSAVKAGTDIAKSVELRQLITQREKGLKKGSARLSNPRALENWGGAAGVNRFAFRWNEGRSAVNDIVAGLGLANA